MINLEVNGNRVYWNKIFCCYAEHSISTPVVGDCCILFSHRHGRNLLNIAGLYWMGDNDNSLPKPDVVIGSVVGPDGILPDAGSFEHLMNLVQVREDDGLSTKGKITWED